MNSIAFITSYVVFPSALSISYLIGKHKDNKRTIANSLIAMGTFTLIQATVTIFNFFQNDGDLTRYILGLGLMLSIFEGCKKIYDGSITMDEYTKNKVFGKK